MQERQKSNLRGFAVADAIVCRAVKWFSYIAVATMLAMGFLAAIDVVTSKLFGKAIPITNDIVKYFMVPTCFCLLGAVQLSGGLMQVDLFSRKYSPAVKRVFDVISNVLGIVIFSFVGYRVCILLGRYISKHELSSMSSYAFPLWPLALICAVSVFVLVFGFIWSILRMFLLPKPQELAPAEREEA